MRPRPHGRGERIGVASSKMRNPVLNAALTTTLQCGHGLRAVENGHVHRGVDVGLDPSMRPRPSGRGEPVTPATAGPPQTAVNQGQLQCGHGLQGRGTGHHTVIAVAAGPQYGPRPSFKAVENACRTPRPGKRARPGTRPRPSGRGELSWCPLPLLTGESVLPFNAPATAADVEEQVPGTEEPIVRSFNAATALRAVKRANPTVSSQRAAGSTVGNPALQCGHGLRAVENSKSPASPPR